MTQTCLIGGESGNRVGEGLVVILLKYSCDTYAVGGQDYPFEKWSLENLPWMGTNVVGGCYELITVLSWRRKSVFQMTGCHTWRCPLPALGAVFLSVSKAELQLSLWTFNKRIYLLSIPKLNSVLPWSTYDCSPIKLSLTLLQKEEKMFSCLR